MPVKFFHAFHGEEGFAKLKLLEHKSQLAPQISVPHILAFRELRKKLHDEGWFETSLLWYLYKTTETVGIGILGLILTYFGHWLIGSILLGLSYQQLGWLGHDYSHQQCFKNRKFNNFMSYIIGTVFSGYSVNWWKDRHNTHHAITNVLEGDPDVDNLPLFVWSVDDINRMSTIPVSEKMIPYQHYYFIPFTMLLKLIWNFQTIAFAQSSHNKHLDKVANKERLCIALHFTWIFLVLYKLLPSWPAALAFFFISEFIGGACIANIVFMNHYACKQMTWIEGQSADFLELQLATTRNVDSGFFMDWFAGGLNFQIEHHLFPTMPRHNLLKVKPIIEKFCKEHGLPYQSLPFHDCMAEVLGKLQIVAETVSQKN